jgi:hypothetical protein
MCLDLSGSGWVSMAGCCERGDEHTGCMKGGEYVGQMSDHQRSQFSLAAYCRVFPRELLPFVRSTCPAHVPHISSPEKYKFRRLKLSRTHNNRDRSLT